MPTRRLLTKIDRRNARSASPQCSSEPLNIVLKAIEAERDNLSRAESLLGCLKIAMEYGDMSHKGPYYPDLLQMACKMVRKSVSALDPINLPEPSRDKVKEDCAAKEVAATTASLDVPLLSRPLFVLPRRCSMRIHRRNYSRASARKSSSRDSASANISGCLAR